MTAYLVFEFEEDTALTDPIVGVLSIRDCWIEVGRVEARSANEALRRFLLSVPPEEDGGVFVAVSERGWQPRRASTRLRVVFEEGG